MFELSFVLLGVVTTIICNRSLGFTNVLSVSALFVVSLDGVGVVGTALFVVSLASVGLVSISVVGVGVVGVGVVPVCDSNCIVVGLCQCSLFDSACSTRRNRELVLVVGVGDGFGSCHCRNQSRFLKSRFLNSGCRRFASWGPMGVCCCRNWLLSVSVLPYLVGLCWCLQNHSVGIGVGTGVCCCRKWAFVSYFLNVLGYVTTFRTFDVLILS